MTLVQILDELVHPNGKSELDHLMVKVTQVQRRLSR
jgi:hypothetical protein